MPQGHASHDTSRPLADWAFRDRLRHYQADVLERVDVDDGSPLHIVAPPGSGKTLLGLLLAARRGRRTVVLAPTATIRAQWAHAAASLVPAGLDAMRSVSEDPRAPGDITALTYQSLSVLDAANPLEGLAVAVWREELEADGRSPDGATTWIDDLRTGNPAAYRSGIARRSRTLRRRLVRHDPDALTRALHPNARALIDRLVAHGVDTVILDECHHLLDHWALVVATLVARLRADGRTPLLIGLTATLPSPDDAEEYENYTALLGDVDYEVPTPAVVKEGNLAPYRDLVRFVEPTSEELAFLRSHADGLAILIRTTFARGAGLQFLVDALQPQPERADASADADGSDTSRSSASGLEPPPPAGGAAPSPAPPPGVEPPAAYDLAGRTERDATDARLAAAFARDFAGSEAAATMLATVAPQHPLVSALPSEARRPPTSEESLRLLARFALDRVLPDPDLAEQWERIRRTLADFGYGLTDRGVRRTRDPVDTMLASSLAKDYAVCDILRIERRELGDDRLRALVVTDFGVHGNRHGGLVGSAGALRTFDVLATDAGTRGLRAILVTGSTTRVAERDADGLATALRDLLGVDVATVPIDGSPAVKELRAPGVGAAVIVRAVAMLLTRGVVHVVVGTRGLFGEGWDCPAVNTLIDLTAVASASATQQLRGRTLRLDPSWPEKVAHNWTVTALLPPAFPLDAAPDDARLRRKHAKLWGLDRDDPALVVRGLTVAMGAEERAALRAVVRREHDVSVGALNDLGERELRPRAETRAQWRVGEEYDDRERVDAIIARHPSAPAFRTSRPASVALSSALAAAGLGAAAGIALAVMSAHPIGIVAGATLAVAAVVLGVPFAQAWRRVRRQFGHHGDTHRRIGRVVWESLHRAGRVAGPRAPEIVVAEGAPREGVVPLSIECPEATVGDQRVFADALAELLGPVRTPRFLLETGRGGDSRLVAAVLRMATGTEDREHFLPVPMAIGRRRDDALAFATLWDRELGPCALHELNHPAALALAARARRGASGAPPPSARERWS